MFAIILFRIFPSAV